MRISSLSPGDMMPTSNLHPATEPALATVVQSILATLDQMGTAIALGEAGDLDGAQALREKHAVKK